MLFSDCLEGVGINYRRGQTKDLRNLQNKGTGDLNKRLVPLVGERRDVLQ